jgi:hypothetical protein
MQGFADDIATGLLPETLWIVGRPRPGPAYEERYVILEEPAEPIQMHWIKNELMPHFRVNCPHCAGQPLERKPLWYVGASTMSRELGILELSWRCFRSAQAYAGNSIGGKTGFIGLLVTISRANFSSSPRVLRCSQRVATVENPWPYNTREELARIWGLLPRLRIHRAAE